MVAEPVFVCRPHVVASRLYAAILLVVYGQKRRVVDVAAVVTGQ